MENNIIQPVKEVSHRKPIHEKAKSEMAALESVNRNNGDSSKITDTTAKNKIELLKSEKVAETEKTAQTKDKQAKQDLIEKVNRLINAYDARITFDFKAEEQETKIVVLEKDSGKVIREIPQEEVAKLSEKMDELTGIIFNRRA